MNRNSEVSKHFQKGIPVVDGARNVQSLNKAMIDQIVDQVLAKMRHGSASPESHRTTDLASGATHISLADQVSPVPFNTRRGSDHMSARQQNRNVPVTKVEYNIVKAQAGQMGMCSRFHKGRGIVHPTCPVCQAERMQKVDNQPRELQIGQE